MPVSATLRRFYEEVEPRLDLVQERTRELLVPYCRENGFVFDDRQKDLSSLAEKIETARYSSIDEVDDLYGATVVTALPTQHDAVVDFLERRFDRHRIVRRHGTRKSPEAFRFDGTRLYVALRHPPDLATIIFEIQVVTLFEFAWARTTHALTYKAEHIDWRRSRVGAMLRAQAEQADLVLQAFDQVADLIQESSWPAIEDKTRIVDFFLERVENGSIPSEVAPRSWSRFGDNLYKAVIGLSGSRRTQFDRGDPLSELDTALEVLDQYVLDNPAERFPRSVSLLQVCVGALAISGDFPGEIRATDYHPPVSKELHDLFPELADLDWSCPPPLITKEEDGE